MKISGIASLHFTDESVAGPGSTITGWKWTIRDQNGTVTTSTGNPSIEYTFSGPGPHEVCLEVTATAGSETCTSTICQTVTSPCVQCLIDACFTWDEVGRTTGPLTGTVTLGFDGTCSDIVNAPTATFRWAFIDLLSGLTTKSGEDQPEGTFTTAMGDGQVIACLNITNNNPIYPDDPECLNDCQCYQINLRTLVGTEIDCVDALFGRIRNPESSEDENTPGMIESGWEHCFRISKSFLQYAQPGRRDERSR